MCFNQAEWVFLLVLKFGDMASWFQEGNPIEDLKRVVEEALRYRENLLIIPGEQKEMFESAAQNAREAGIYVPRLKAVWRKEKE